MRKYLPLCTVLQDTYEQILDCGFTQLGISNYVQLSATISRFSD